METEIGEVIHFFDKIGVGIIKLSDVLKVGDKIKVVGGKREFEQEVASIQVEHAPIEEAKAGAEVGVKLEKEAKEGDKVYRITE